MTNAESTQANFHTIVTVQDNKLSNTTSNNFFCLPNEKKKKKKTAENNHTQTLPSEKMWNKHKATMHEK